MLKKLILGIAAFILPLDAHEGACAFPIEYEACASLGLLPIKKVVLWGHKLHSHTHSYIHAAFYKAFKHLGYETYWLDNNDDVSRQDFSGSLFITEGQVDSHLPIRNDCFYILHNCSDAKYKALYEQGRAICLQVYTHDCRGRQVVYVDDYIGYTLADKCFYMPWATDLLPHEIEMRKYSMNRVRKNKKQIYFIGTIGGGEFGNDMIVNSFKQACEENKVHFKGIARVSEEENARLIQEAYMAPALQGSWQVQQGYIPCRIFKNISNGQLGITNSETVYKLFKEKIVYNSNPYQLFYDAKQRLETVTLAELHELMDFVKDKHTYLSRIKVLADFLYLVHEDVRRKV